VLARWRPADAPFSSTAPVLPDDDLRHRPCACRHTPKPYVCLHACLSWLRTCHGSVGGAGFAVGLSRSSSIPLATGAGQGAEPGGTCVSGASAAGSTSRAHLDVDRYVRVEQRSNEQAAIQENEVRITAAGKMRNYISYATASRGAPAQCSPEAGEGSLLSADGGSGGAAQEKGHTAVVLKAMGRAINKTVTIGAARPRHPLSGAHRRAAPALCVGMCRMAGVARRAAVLTCGPRAPGPRS